MRYASEVLLDTLHNFEQSGWGVDYGELSGKGRVCNTPDYADVIATFLLIPDEKSFVLDWRVSMNAAFNSRAKDFLSSLSKQLLTEDMVLQWEKSDFVYRWKVGGSDMFNLESSEECKAVLVDYLTTGYALVYSSIHILHDCGLAGNQSLPACESKDLVAFVCGLSPTEARH
jgi:hypothetical protein